MGNQPQTLVVGEAAPWATKKLLLVRRSEVTKVKADDIGARDGWVPGAAYNGFTGIIGKRFVTCHHIGGGDVARNFSLCIVGNSLQVEPGLGVFNRCPCECWAWLWNYWLKGGSINVPISLLECFPNGRFSPHLRPKLLFIVCRQPYFGCIVTFTVRITPVGNPIPIRIKRQIIIVNIILRVITSVCPHNIGPPNIRVLLLPGKIDQNKFCLIDIWIKVIIVDVKNRVIVYVKIQNIKIVTTKDVVPYIRPYNQVAVNGYNPLPVKTDMSLFRNGELSVPRITKIRVLPIEKAISIFIMP